MLYITNIGFYNTNKELDNTRLKILKVLTNIKTIL
jgi:hypothetical protein